MTFQTGNVLGYLNLLDTLVKIATGNHVETVAINNAGTGYVAGDLLTVAGGTFSFAARIEVLTVGGGGAITGVRVYEGGAYTVNPGTLTGNAVTGGTGTGATMDITMLATGWTERLRTKEAASATIANGGSGGTNGAQVVTVVGGVGVGVAAQFNVTVTGGAITSVDSVATPGNYEQVPANPVQVTGAGLSGATLNVTWQNAVTQGDQKVILEGVGGGSDTILVGIYSFQDTLSLDTAFNWGLNGFSGFNSSLAYASQAGISPGGPPQDASQGAYVTLRDSNASFPIDFWFSMTSRRIIGFFKVRNATITHYASLHLGFLNPFGTFTEFPYPLYISGNTSRSNAPYNHTEAPRVSSIGELIKRNGSTGPGWWRHTDGVWKEVFNSSATDGGSPTRSSNNDFTFYPFGVTNNSQFVVDDQVVDDSGINTLQHLDYIPTTGVPGTETVRYFETPDSGGDTRLLVPLTLIGTTASPAVVDIMGEMEGVFWFSAFGATTATSEDRLRIGNDFYRVFQPGNRTVAYGYICVKEQ